MKKTMATILILLLALQAFYPLIVYSYYYANQSFIAAVLCENRDAPQLKCKGKCYLNKQLKKSEGPDHQKEEAAEKFEVPVYLPASPLASIKTESFSISGQYPSRAKDNCLSGFEPSLFRPPAFVAAPYSEC